MLIPHCGLHGFEYLTIYFYLKIKMFAKAQRQLSVFILLDAQLLVNMFSY